MINTVDTIKQTIKDLENLVEVASKLTGGNPSSGPLWYTKKALQWIDAAVKLSGFTVGGEARLTQDVPCVQGWAADAHNLIAGKVGVVLDIDFDPEEGTCVCFSPHNQTWIPTYTYENQGIFKGVPQPVVNNHCFWISAKYFK